MTLFHLILGIAVVVLCAAAGLLGLLRRKGPRAATIGAWALGALAVQVASGMFLLTATSEGPDLPHVLLPLTALAAVAGTRLMQTDARITATAAAYGFAAVASLAAFGMGVLHG